ncbi:MAG TPA: hypothetical protein VIK52_01620 [Opitutaceae bacterium]
MTKIPQSGDPELLPLGTVTRPTVIDDALLAHGDIDDLPWKRARGDEWTLPDLRRLVFDFIVGFFDSRDWPTSWEVVEKASAVRSGRLPVEQYHLVLAMTRKKDGHRYEVAVTFPSDARADRPDLVSAVLNQAAVALDALQAGDV